MSSRTNPLPSEQFKALLADPALRERFLPPMTPEEIEAVERLLDPVVEEAERWSGTYTSIANPIMILPIALLAIVAFPSLSPPRLATMVKLILWVYAFDDFVDIPERSITDIAQVAEQCYVAGSFDVQQHDINNIYAHALLSIKQELSSWDMFSHFHATWVMCLSRLIDAIIIQGKASRLHVYASALPSVDDYLFFACHGIGFPLLCMTGIMGMDKDEPLRKLPSLLELCERCGAMIRLANDVRSFEQEIKDGSLNALAITLRLTNNEPSAHDERVLQQATKDIMLIIARERAAAASLVLSLEESTPLGLKFQRCAEVAVQIFVKGDLRTWPLYQEETKDLS